MPQPTGWVELEPASILSGVDHKYPTGADSQVIDIGPAPRDGQVVQDGPPVPLQWTQEPGGTLLPRPPPAAKQRRPGWAETAAPTQPPRPPKRRRPAPAGAPAGCQGLPGQHRSQGRRPPARADSGSRPPGRPTVARTRTATTGGSVPVPAGSWSGSSVRWARMACRSAWLSGRTDPLGRSSSSKGNRRGWGWPPGTERPLTVDVNRLYVA